MLGFLISLLLIALFVVVFLLGIGLFLLSKIFGGIGNAMSMVRKFFGIGQKPSAQNASNSRTSYSDGASYTSSSGGSSKGENSGSSGKMFERDEGTYVDFEEVK